METLIIRSSLGFAATIASGCPLTEVKRYEFSCGAQGDIFNPSRLQTIKKVRTYKTCANICLKNSLCRSFNYVHNIATCHLYKKYLDQMVTTYDSYQPGLLYDRECFSTDCNLIAACNASASCEEDFFKVGDPGSSSGEYFQYNQYSCNYGVTAKSVNQVGVPFTNTRIFFNASKVNACQAIDMCAFGGNLGTFDVHLVLASNMWECVYYDDDYDLKGSAGSSGTHCDPTPEEEDAVRRRYTVRNESIGAGYGFMWIGRGYLAEGDSYLTCDA